jgi:hypothetical protein
MKKPLVLRVTEPSGPRRSGGSDYVEVSGATDDGTVFKFTVLRSAIAPAFAIDARPGVAIEANLTHLREADPDEFVPEEENVARL